MIEKMNPIDWISVVLVILFVIGFVYVISIKIVSLPCITCKSDTPHFRHKDKDGGVFMVCQICGTNITIKRNNHGED